MGSKPTKGRRLSVAEPSPAEPVFIRSSSAPAPKIVVEQSPEEKPPSPVKKADSASKVRQYTKKKSNTVKPIMSKSESIHVDVPASSKLHKHQQSPVKKAQRSLSVNALNIVPANKLAFTGPGSVLGSPPPSRGYKTIKDRCYYCGAADHYHDMCVKGEPAKCSKCGELGHINKYCERYHLNY